MKKKMPNTNVSCKVIHGQVISPWLHLLQKPELESKLKVDRLMPKAQSFIEKVGS